MELQERETIWADATPAAVLKGWGRLLDYIVDLDNINIESFAFVARTRKPDGNREEFVVMGGTYEAIDEILGAAEVQLIHQIVDSGHTATGALEARVLGKPAEALTLVGDMRDDSVDYLRLAKPQSHDYTFGGAL